ncbi:MAG TPA: hypothetical protein VL100_09560 [Croceibacterium sp.]|nr:hypothetical protein [Croceibacterium sp.]
MSDLPIHAPAAYYPPFAVAFADGEGNGLVVDAANPLPVTVAPAAPETSTPITGSLSASGVVGPFDPAPGRAIWLSLSGTWTGTVTVQRSIDGGTTKLPLTSGGLPWAAFTGNACEPVAEDGESGAAYYLDVTLASGTLTYRLAQ